MLVRVAEHAGGSGIGAEIKAYSDQVAATGNQV